SSREVVTSINGGSNSINGSILLYNSWIFFPFTGGTISKENRVLPAAFFICSVTFMSVHIALSIEGLFYLISSNEPQGNSFIYFIATNEPIGIRQKPIVAFTPLLHGYIGTLTNIIFKFPNLHIFK